MQAYLEQRFGDYVKESNVDSCDLVIELESEKVVMFLEVNQSVNKDNRLAEDTRRFLKRTNLGWYKSFSDSFEVSPKNTLVVIFPQFFIPFFRFPF